MKSYLKETLGHHEIEKIDMDELKLQIEGEPTLARIKYRRQVGII